MAKKMVRPRPGALQQLLKERAMAQLDADVANGGISPKTLRKVNRGGEIKLETLQKLAKNLRVPITFFEATPAGGEVSGPSDSMDTVMLCRLDAPGFLELFVDADRVEWLPNIRLMEAETQRILQDLDGAGAKARNFYEDGTVSAWVRTADLVFKAMEELKQRRLGVLGANYLFWTCSSESWTCSSERSIWKERELRYKPLLTALFSSLPKLSPKWLGILGRA
jgi:hypothetical protein